MIKNQIQEDIIITFEEYLHDHLKMSLEDYEVVMAKLKANKLHAFPNLYQSNLKSKDDVSTEVELLNQTNNIYGILVKYLLMVQMKKQNNKEKKHELKQ